MEPGNIIEYIDQQKIISAVVTALENDQARLLNEYDQELTLSSRRIVHTDSSRIDLALPRQELVHCLQQTAREQTERSRQIDVQALWNVLRETPQWIDVPRAARLCFPDQEDGVCESAVIRALFDHRTHFKFDRTRFYPYTPEQVETLQAQAEEARKNRDLVQQGCAWLVEKVQNPHPVSMEEDGVFVDLFRSFFLFEKESPHYGICKAILGASGLALPLDLFSLLEKLKVFDLHENLDLLRLGIPSDFPPDVLEMAEKLASPAKKDFGKGRVDLTHLEALTVDGPGTLDFDDALSITHTREGFELGVHIADVAHFIKPGDPLDREAMRRGSSIYTPDRIIPMLPNLLAEGVCSLNLEAHKPALSVLIRLTPMASIRDFRILPSIIRIKHRLTYEEADLLALKNPKIMMMIQAAKRFREKRLSQGALHISLPEIHFATDDKTGILPVHVDRESPGRMMVAELMIMANWLMATHLQSKGMPAVFRSQADPKERLFRNNEGSLFQNYMQRRLLNRFVLAGKPGRHSGLGLEAYVTGTSPIRKFFDLVSQRQIRATLGLETPYSAEDIQGIIEALNPPLANIGKIQTRRNRYWILKHLEKKIGDQVEAMVLQKRRNDYQILIKDYMLECGLETPIRLKPEDFIRVKLQRVDARKDALSVFLA